MTVFAVTPQYLGDAHLKDAVLFSSQEKAEAYLRNLAAERPEGSVVMHTPTVLVYKEMWGKTVMSDEVTFTLTELPVF